MHLSTISLNDGYHILESITR